MQDVVTCLKLFAVAWVGGILIGEKSGLVFALSTVIHCVS